MKKKIFTSIFYTSLIIALLSIFLITYLLYYYHNQNQLEDLKDISDLLVAGYDDEGDKYLSQLQTNLRITLIDKDGKVVYDSLVNPEALDDHSNREEFIQAMDNGESSVIKYSPTLKRDTLNYAKKINSDLVLRVSTDEASYFEILGRLFQPIVWILVLGFVLSALLSYLISKSLIKPLNDLDLNNLKPIEAYSEVNVLINKIHNQQKDLKEQIDNNRKLVEDFNVIVENMKEGLIILDNKGKVIAINPAAYELLNLEPSKKLSQKELNRFLKDESSQKGLEIGNRIVSVLSSPVFDDKKRTGTIILLMDETERKRREKLRAQYFSNLSHELKTPITSISGYSEIIKNGIARKEDIPSFIDRIYDESQHLNNLIKRILLISKLDEEELRLDKSKTDVSQILNTVLERLRPLAKKKNINLVEEVTPRLVLIANADLLTELFYNLIDNAIKYTGPGGSVEVKFFKENETIIFRVKDSGIGIASEEKDRIFERFYRSDKSRSKDGTGLGLAIVKKSLIFHDADIDVQSEPEKGSVFLVSFN